MNSRRGVPQLRCVRRSVLRIIVAGSWRGFPTNLSNLRVTVVEELDELRSC